MPPGIRLSSGLAANAARESVAPENVSAIQDGDTTCSPVNDVPPLRNSEPNRTRSRRLALIPPSNMPVPTESTPIVASFSAPSLAPQQLATSARASARPLAASQIQPSTSVSHDRYSNGPPCGDFCCRLSRKSCMVVGRSGTGAAPTRWPGRAAAPAPSGPGSPRRTLMPDRMSSRWRTVAPAYPDWPARARSWSAPPPTSSTPVTKAAPATMPISDLLTDISRCWVSSAMPP